MSGSPSNVLIWAAGQQIRANEHPKYIRNKLSETLRAGTSSSSSSASSTPTSTPATRGRGRAKFIQTRQPRSPDDNVFSWNDNNNVDGGDINVKDARTPSSNNTSSSDSDSWGSGVDSPQLKTPETSSFHQLKEEDASPSTSENCLLHKEDDADSSKEKLCLIDSDSSASSTKSVTGTTRAARMRKMLEMKRMRDSRKSDKTLDEAISIDDFKNGQITDDDKKAIFNVKPILVCDGSFKRNINVVRSLDKLFCQGPMFFPEPFKDIENSYIERTLKESLLKHEITKLQSNVWPSILRGLNVCSIVNKQNNIFSYLPPVLQLNLQKIREFRNENPGILTAILCRNSETCKKVFKKTRELLTGDESNVHLVSEDENNVIVDKNCNIIISPVNMFLRKESKIDLTNLHFVVIDEAYLVMKEDAGTIVRIFKDLNTMITTKRLNGYLQIIVSSEKWSKDLKIFWQNLRVPPYICIENLMETAWYGDVDFIRHEVTKTYEKSELEKIVRVDYLTKKTIIFCDEIDLKTITEYLRYKSLEVVMVSKHMSDETIIEYENAWIHAKEGFYRVLICSDGSFRKMKNIRTASVIINYRLPDNRDLFTQRLRSILGNIPYIHDKSSMIKIRVVLFVEKENSDEVYYNFVQGKNRNTTSHIQF